VAGGVFLALALLAVPAAAWEQHASEHTAAGDWVRAVEEHQPGRVDAPLLSISEWTARQLEDALHGLRSYFVLPRRGNRAGANAVLARGALLHTDIAMLLPARAVKFRGLSSWPIQSGVQGMDGEDRGSGPITGHWAFARVLLDRIEPDPSRDDFVRRWYVTVAVVAQFHGEYAISLQHLSRARQVLREDPDILFLSGTMHEAFASPRHQTVLLAYSMHFRPRPRLDSPRTELQRAERYFRDSLQRRPAMIEARLHLGQVLGRIGQHDEAAAELRSVVAALGDDPDPIRTYYAQLILGREEAALGRRDAARACFEAALVVYPDAQSPRLALSALARDGADRAEALRALRSIGRLDPDERRDPWWIYTIAHGRHADRLLAELRAPFLRGKGSALP
jgi:tetratricopeptide (TPR) repeat protein